MFVHKFMHLMSHQLAGGCLVHKTEKDGIQTSDPNIGATCKGKTCTEGYKWCLYPCLDSPAVANEQYLAYML